MAVSASSIATLSAGTGGARRPTTAVHVWDYAAVPAGQLREAQRAVDDVFGAVGIMMRWLGGSAALAPRDDAFHLDAILMSARMVASGREAEAVLGRADSVSRRAYVFYPRIVDYAISNTTPIARVLAYVLAHEIAHAIVPQAHAPRGLMQATLHGRAPILPSFTNGQAHELRAQLGPGGLLADITRPAVKVAPGSPALPAAAPIGIPPEP